jgi:TPR repeat protein
MIEDSEGEKNCKTKKALPWYQLAAEQGNIYAQMNVGNMFEDGKGVVEVDKEEAMRWYQLAANQGDIDAKQILKKNKRYKKPQTF